jgi:prevent-host-death family protein
MRRKARANLYRLIAKTVDTSVPIQITSKNGDAVLISMADWNAMQETLYLTSIPGMTQSIKAAMSAPPEEFTPMDEVDWN